MWYLIKSFRHTSEVCLVIKISRKGSRLLSEDMIFCIRSKYFTLFRDIPLGVMIVYEDVIQGEPGSISIPIDFDAWAAEEWLGADGVV